MSMDTRPLLACGVAAPVLYVAGDLLGSAFYPGYSYRDQAVSELFAIGAPTSTLVATIFTISSLLLLPCARGVWLSSGGVRALRVLAWMLVFDALDTIPLWTAFPMHMRGAPQDFSDTMHALLAVNPFVAAAIVCGIVAFRGPMRTYSIFTLAALVVLAAGAFHYVPALAANEPTPWMGIGERGGQYLHQLWLAVLCIGLMRSAPARR